MAGAGQMPVIEATCFLDEVRRAQMANANVPLVSTCLGNRNGADVALPNPEMT